MGVLDNARRGPRTGGEVVRHHIAQTTGGEDAYVFSYRRLEVHAYVLPEPVPHVLYCTYGKSRVESSQPVAGTQTELTLRVPGTPALPDEWPARLLARAARDDIEPGHYLVLDTPRDTLTGFVFVTDPILGVLDGPTGLIRFTYAVGINGDDVEQMLSWDPLKFAAFVGDRVPLGLTSTDRDTISARPQDRALLEDTVAGTTIWSLAHSVVGECGLSSSHVSRLSSANDLPCSRRWRAARSNARAAAGSRSTRPSASTSR